MGQSWCGKSHDAKNKRSEQFYCAAKEHYPELVGDGLCEKQCKRCRKMKQ